MTESTRGHTAQSVLLHRCRTGVHGRRSRVDERARSSTNCSSITGSYDSDIPPSDETPNISWSNGSALHVVGEDRRAGGASGGLAAEFQANVDRVNVSSSSAHLLPARYTRGWTRSLRCDSGRTRPTRSTRPSTRSSTARVTAGRTCRARTSTCRSRTRRSSDACTPRSGWCSC